MDGLTLLKKVQDPVLVLLVGCLEAAGNKTHINKTP